jgi:autotransporter passenger strand-loop-strand repeat protein
VGFDPCVCIPTEGSLVGQWVPSGRWLLNRTGTGPDDRFTAAILPSDCEPYCPQAPEPRFVEEAARIPRPGAILLTAMPIRRSHGWFLRDRQAGFDMTTVSRGQISAASSGSTSGGVLSGGRLNVSGGGVISGAVDSGGFDVVSASGLALSAIVGSGGTQYDLGNASSTIVISGGTEIVASGGTAAATIVSGGGNENVSSNLHRLPMPLLAAGVLGLFCSATGVVV